MTRQTICPAPIPIRHFVLHNVGQGFLGLFLGRFNALQFHPLTVGGEVIAIMAVEESGAWVLRR